MSDRQRKKGDTILIPYPLPTIYYLPSSPSPSPSLSPSTTPLPTPTTGHLPPTTTCLLPPTYYQTLTFYFLPTTCHPPPPTFYFSSNTSHLSLIIPHLPPSTFYLPTITYHRSIFQMAPTIHTIQIDNNYLHKDTILPHYLQSSHILKLRSETNLNNLSNSGRKPDLICRILAHRLGLHFDTMYTADEDE